MPMHTPDKVTGEINFWQASWFLKISWNLKATLQRPDIINEMSAHRSNLTKFMELFCEGEPCRYCTLDFKHHNPYCVST